jgi:lipid A 4'-phosphatase
MILAALTALSILSNGQYIGWPIRNIIFIFLTFSLGPGLIVNGVLKEFIGRARPKNIMGFGGEKIFSPAYFPSDQCAYNCSFVSGDVAFAFATIAFPLLLSGAKKKAGIIISIVFGMSIAFYRLGTGAHFLSDTVLAGLLSVITALFCYIIIIEKPSLKN